MTTRKTRKPDPRKTLEAHLTAAGMAVCHSRTQRDGSIRVYLYRADVATRATEIHWSPRCPDGLALYACDDGIETYVGDRDLPADLLAALAAG